MIKTLLLCAFFAATLAAPTWTGKWLVTNELTAYPDLCDVPLNGTDAFVEFSNHKLVLRGISTNTHHNKTWTLGWNTSEQYGSTCYDITQESNCVSGYVFEASEGSFLNISWNKPDYRWCSSLFVPVNADDHKSDSPKDDKKSATGSGKQGGDLNNEEGSFDQELISGVPWFFANEDPWFFAFNGEPRDDDKFLRK